MTVTVDGKKYHVSLNDGTDTYGLNIVLGSDSRTIRNEWAAVVSPSGQTPAVSTWQLVGWEDWAAGVGLERYSAKAPGRYLLGSGIETRAAGRVQLGGLWSAQDLARTATANPLDFGANLYVPCGLRLRKYDVVGGNWTSVNGSDYGANITHLHVSNGLLFVALGTTADIIRYDAGLTPTTLTGFKAQCFCTALGKLWCGTGSIIYSSTDNGATWAIGPAIGDSTTNIVSLASHGGKIYIGKDDGLWSYDGTTVTQVLDVSTMKYAGNFKHMCEWKGDLYYNVLRRVYRLATRPVDITPSLAGDANKELYGWGVPVMLCAAAGSLLVGFKSGEGSYASVLAYDGSAWHPLYTYVAATLAAVGYSQNAGWIIANDGATRVMSVVAQADRPSANYADSGYIEFPWFDGGYRLYKKSGSSVVVESRDCTATETLTVKFRTAPGAAFTTAGSAITSSTSPATLALAASGALEFYRIQFRVEFARGADATKTPALTGLALRNLVRSVTPAPAGGTSSRKAEHRVTVWLSKRQRTGGA